MTVRQLLEMFGDDAPLEITADDVRAAIAAHMAETERPVTMHWCALCGAYTDDVLCNPCERDVLLRDGGEA